MLRARRQARRPVFGVVRGDDVVLRGRAGRRPQEGGVLQGTARGPADRGGSAGGPGGSPLEVTYWEGNTAAATTILPTDRAFQDRHGLADIVVVADAGMLPRRTCASWTGRVSGSSSGPGPRKPRAPGIASSLAWGRVHQWAGHRYDHAPRGDQQGRGGQRHGHAGRARLGPGRASAVMAGSAGILARASHPRRHDAAPCRRTWRKPRSRARRPSAHRGSSPTRPGRWRWTRGLWPGPAAWSG